MIEYFVSQNLPLGGVLLFYLFYIPLLLILSVTYSLRVEGIRRNLEYKKKEEERLTKLDLESKYAAFKYNIKAINFFYRYWRIVWTK